MSSNLSSIYSGFSSEPSPQSSSKSQRTSSETQTWLEKKFYKPTKLVASNTISKLVRFVHCSCNGRVFLVHSRQWLVLASRSRWSWCRQRPHQRQTPRLCLSQNQPDESWRLLDWVKNYRSSFKERPWGADKHCHQLHCVTNWKGVPTRDLRT